MCCYVQKILLLLSFQQHKYIPTDRYNNNNSLVYVTNDFIIVCKKNNVSRVSPRSDEPQTTAPKKEITTLG